LDDIAQIGKGGTTLRKRLAMQWGRWVRVVGLLASGLGDDLGAC